MKKFLSVMIAALMLCVMMVSCGEVSVDDEIKIPIRTGNQINYNTARARRGTLIEQVPLPAGITTPYTTNLSFTRMSGKIASIEVRQDQEVHKGDVIAVLSDEELEEDIVIQQLSLNSAQSVYDALVAQHARSEDIEFARINLDIEQLKYDALVESREYLVLRAPFDGRIVSINNYYVGSRINKNSPFCTISDSSKVCLTVSDPWNILTNVSFGTRVDVTQGALASTTGKVVDTLTSEYRNREGQTFTTISYVIQCDEDVEFSDLGGIEVIFTTLRRDDAIIVPIEAVYEAIDSRDVSSNYVNVLVNGIKVQTAVTVGVVTDDKAEILNGLDGTETLILP